VPFYITFTAYFIPLFPDVVLSGQACILGNSTPELCCLFGFILSR